MAATIDLSELEKDPRLFLYTSLTAGSSHIITATSRMETILKANKIPFQAIDTATDEKARKLWQRRAGKRKLPGLVKEGLVLGDLDEIEEWNEFGELKDNIGPVPPGNAAPAGGQTGVNIAPPLPVIPTAISGNAQSTGPINKAPAPVLDDSKSRPLPGAAEIAARNAAKQESAVIDTPPKLETMTSAPAEKAESLHVAAAASENQATATQESASGSSSTSKIEATTSTPASKGSLNVASAMSKHNMDHLSAPASRIQSGTATPNPEPASSIPDTTGSATEIGTASAPGADTSDAGGVESSDIPTQGKSQVQEAPTDEVKKAESEPALPKAVEGEQGSAVSNMEGLKIGEEPKTQEQDAKAAEDAGKSVED